MGQRATKPDGYQPTLQVTQDSKRMLVEWMTTHGNPEMRYIIGKAIRFLLEGPPELQHVAFGLIPRDQADGYARALHAAADRVSDQLDTWGEIPRDLYAELSELARGQNLTVEQYLRNHVSQQAEIRSRSTEKSKRGRS